MRSRTAPVTKRARLEAARSRGCASRSGHLSRGMLGMLGILMAASAGGCVLGNDNDRPVLQVDVLWDTSPGDRFLGRSCPSSDTPAFMTWNIRDRRGKSVEKVDELEPCKNFNFYGLVSGSYQLELHGYDRREQELWSGTCKGLSLGRFDVLESCKIDQLSEGDADAQGASDAGEPDAGGASDASDASDL